MSPPPPPPPPPLTTKIPSNNQAKFRWEICEEIVCLKFCMIKVLQVTYKLYKVIVVS